MADRLASYPPNLQRIAYAAVSYFYRFDDFGDVPPLFLARDGVTNAAQAVAETFIARPMTLTYIDINLSVNCPDDKLLFIVEVLGSCTNTVGGRDGLQQRLHKDC